MSNEQHSPWANGEGFGTPAPKPQQPPSPEAPPTLDMPAPNYENPRLDAAPDAEPSGWSQPQQFFVPSHGVQPQHPAPYAFGQRLPYGTPAQPPMHPKAVPALVVGIVGIATLLVGFPFVSPVAWYLAAKGRREVRQNPGAYRDSGILTAGFVLGIVGTLVAIAFIALIVLAIILFVGSN